jgi:two-component system, NarL family, nitrate/nitrite response regulator NarL
MATRRVDVDKPLPTPSLTERERQIMRLVCEGHSNKEVARKLSVSEGTVNVHLHHVFEKLAIRNRTELVAYHFGPAELE